ncbi:MAG TPA: hypothetical protein PLS03_06510, partial [Terrimicrobiaceae bacterium]|nr:hypothetical protein [Terrimicrobiaceae bacterium]
FKIFLLNYQQLFRHAPQLPLRHPGLHFLSGRVQYFPSAATAMIHAVQLLRRSRNRSTPRIPQDLSMKMIR